MMSYGEKRAREIIEALNIFLERDPTALNFSAHHDECYLARDTDKLTDADKVRLEELRIHRSEDYGGWLFFT